MTNNATNAPTPGDVLENTQHAINKLTASFVLPAEESLFRTEVWREWRGQLSVALALFAVINILWIYIDFLALGPTSAYFFLLVGRLLVAATVVGVVLVTHYRPAPLIADAGAIAFVVIQTIVGCGGMVLKQEPATVYAMGGVLFTLYHYILIPNRFLWSVAAGVIAGGVFIWCSIIGSNPTSRELATVIVILVMCNVAGAATAHRAHRLQRMRFASLVDERSARAEIEREVRAKDRAIAAAEEAVQAKTHFLASASHDLRQPTQALMLFSAVLQQRDLDESGNKAVEGIVQSGKALQRLLTSLLDISRLDSGLIERKDTTFDLTSLVQRLVSEITPQAAEKDLRVRAVLPAITTTTDPELLERILRNLLVNAVKYTDDGGILVGCRRRGGWARIEVWDTGIGIADSDNDKIFNDFYQVHNSERELSKGLGLGLSNVRRMADLLGLQVGVRSIEGRGSVFSIDVPIAEPVMEEDKEAASLASRTGGDVQSILLIDDDRHVLESFKLLTEQWGHRALVADSEEAAHHVLDQSDVAPDIILADYRLRDGRTGIQAIASMRDRLGDGVKAIILTGDTAPDLLREMAHSGLEILHKPLDAQKLEGVLAAS